MNTQDKIEEKVSVAPVKFDASYIGCVIDNSSFSADDCNSETIEFASQYGFKYEPIEVNGEDYSQILSEEADNAISWLNDQDNLPYCSWYFEDNSLFYAPYLDAAKDETDFVSTKEQEYPRFDNGQWLHINDHGNVTLYVREKGEDREIWGIV